MNAKYALRCVAPDGEYVTEASHFATTEAAWERANDMGSRWIFYPIYIVTTNGRSTRKTRIRDVPYGMHGDWIGKTFGRFLDAVKDNKEAVYAYANGEEPRLEVFP